MLATMSYTGRQMKNMEAVVGRATKYSSRDIHDALFASAVLPPSPRRPRTLEEMDAGVRALMRRKHGMP